MTHSKASFSSAQIKRLIKLRAVVKVSPSRIRYAEWFKREFSVDMDTEQDREVSKVDVRDVRDLIICKQTRYIESLQRQIDELRLQLAQQTKSNDMQ